MTISCPVSVVIPTRKRIDRLSSTLERVLECRPSPAEILVHVDGDDAETADWLREIHPEIRVLESPRRIGPGGGRNRLINSARNSIVASFDDDSYPLDADYFKRVQTVFRTYPDASIIAGYIVERDEQPQDAKMLIGATSHFGGGGVVYRREHFLETNGYLAMPVAYGIEEVDLCLRMFHVGRRIYYCPWLRVFHDTDRSRHASSTITAASISNLALLVYIRYPKRYWAYGILQVLNRIWWLIRMKRMRGIGKGLFEIPAIIWNYRRQRNSVSAASIARFFRVRNCGPQLSSIFRQKNSNGATEEC